MKNLSRFVLLSLVSVLLFSCKIKNDNEKEIAYHQELLDYSESYLRMYRNQFSSIQMEDQHSWNSLNANNQILITDSLIKRFKNTTHDLYVAYDNKKASDFFIEYTSFLNRMDSLIEFDKNYIFRNRTKINPFENNQDNFVTFLKLRLDLNVALTNFYVYLYDRYDDAGFIITSNDVTSTISTDLIGNAKITLYSDGVSSAYQLEKGLMFYLDEITKNRKPIKKNYIYTINTAFLDISFDSLEVGDYNVKGKIRYLTRKGVKDYPYEQSFKMQ